MYDKQHFSSPSCSWPPSDCGQGKAYAFDILSPPSWAVYLQMSCHFWQSYHLYALPDIFYTREQFILLAQNLLCNTWKGPTRCFFEQRFSPSGSPLPLVSSDISSKSDYTQELFFVRRRRPKTMTEARYLEIALRSCLTQWLKLKVACKKPLTCPSRPLVRILLPKRQVTTHV